MSTGEKARQYNRMRRNWLKEHGICVDCAQRDAFAKHIRCEFCLEKAVKYREPTDLKRAYKREWVRQRIAKGLCINCAKPVYSGSDRYCEICHSRYKARNREAKRIKLGIIPSEERTKRNHEIWSKNLVIARKSPKYIKHVKELGATFSKLYFRKKEIKG